MGLHWKRAFKLSISGSDLVQRGNACSGLRRVGGYQMPLQGQLRPGTMADYLTYTHCACCPRRVGEHVVLVA